MGWKPLSTVLPFNCSFCSRPRGPGWRNGDLANGIQRFDSERDLKQRTRGMIASRLDRLLYVVGACRDINSNVFPFQHVLFSCGQYRKPTPLEYFDNPKRIQNGVF